MSNPRLAGRYAKSLLDLSIEQNQLESVYADIKLLKSICKSNADFVAMLQSPVINSGKKEQILSSLLSEKINKITFLFLQLLINKNRENNLPEMVQAFIEQYNKMNDIHRVTLTTATPVSKELQDAIVAKVTASTSIQKIELETAVKDELIGGFTLELDNLFVDASVLRDLNDVKKQFKNNEYIHSIR
jgi:F-type H+-transporting ATPase subunit delta